MPAHDRAHDRTESLSQRYRDALAWLFARHRGGAPRDAARMAGLIRRLSLPIPPASVHVVGTNGKGSVAAMVAAGLSASGRRSGLFTSPHVEDFRERIAVGGARIPAERVVAEVDRLRRDPAADDTAFFELTLALALRHFERERVEVAVIEAGIGARRDATNAVGNRVLSILTNVALDHQAQLGDDLAAIATDKLATLRRGVPLVAGLSETLAELAAASAAALDAPLLLDRSDDPRFDDPWLDEDAREDDPAMRQNRRLAAAALRQLGADGVQVREGLRAPPLPARRERFVVDGVPVLLDGAHDPAAAAKLRAALSRRYLLLFGALQRKRGAATLAELAPSAAQVLLTEARVGDGRPPWAGALPFEPDAERALDRALRNRPPDGGVVIAGSLYLAGRMRPLLRVHRRP